MEFTISFIQHFFVSLQLVSPLLLSLSIFVILLGQIVGKIEKWDKFNGLYWSLITATTVGYGDVRPTKRRSKILSIVIALVGLVLTGIIIAVALNSVSTTLEQHANQHVIEKLKDI